MKQDSDHVLRLTIQMWFIEIQVTFLTIYVHQFCARSHYEGRGCDGLYKYRGDVYG